MLLETPTFSCNLCGNLTAFVFNFTAAPISLYYTFLIEINVYMDVPGPAEQETRSQNSLTGYSNMSFLSQITPFKNQSLKIITNFPQNAHKMKDMDLTFITFF